MDIIEYLDQNKEIQCNILSYIEDEENCDENFENLERWLMIKISNKYASKKYPQYFSPEIRPFIEEKWLP